MRTRFGAWCALALLFALSATGLAQSPLLWSTHHSFPVKSVESPQRIQRGPDGSYYTIANAPNTMEIRRYTAAGQLVWARQFEGLGYDLAVNGTSVVVVGSVDRGPKFPPSKYDGLLLRIDLAGNLSTPIYYSKGSFGEVELAANGDAVVASNTPVSPGSQDISAGYMRFRPDGAVVDSKVYIAVKSAFAHGIVVNGAGITVIGGVVETGNRFIAHYGTDGVLNWDHSVTVSGYQPIQHKTDAAGSTYLLLGYYNSDTDDNGSRFLKFAADGTQVWDKNLGYPGLLAVHPSGRSAIGPIQYSADGQIEWTANINEPNSVLQANAYDDEGNLYLSGYTYSPTSEGSNKAFIAKVGPDGVLQWILDDPAVLGLGAAPLIATSNEAVAIFGQIQGPYARGDLAIVKVDANGQRLWRTETGPSEGMEEVLDTAVDPSGNVYLVGRSESGPFPHAQGFLAKVGSNGLLEWSRQYSRTLYNVEAYPDGGVVALEGDRRVGPGVAVRRYSASGQLLWENSAPDFSDRIDYFRSERLTPKHSLVVDSAGNIYLVGLNLNKGPRVLVRKLSPTGATLWNAGWDPTSTLTTGYKPMDIAVAANGLVYVALESEYYSDGNASLLQISASGVVNWSQPYSDPWNPSYGIALATDKESNVYWMGKESWAPFVRKVGTDGTVLWTAKIPTSPYSPQMAGIVLDPAGNVFVAESQINGRSASPDYKVMLFKVNPAGEVQWTRLWNDPGGEYETASGLAMDSAGTLVIAGTTWNVANARDYFVVRYSSEGDILWPDSGSVFRNGAAIYDSGWGLSEILSGVGLDSQGSIYLAGSSVGPGGTRDLNVVKYSNAGVRPALSSEFAGQDVAGTMTSGQTYSAMISFKNTGSETWTKSAGFKLQSSNGAWGASSISLADGEMVNPGQTKKFRLTFYAPSSAGTYNFRWRMAKGGAPFGQASPNVAAQVVKKAHAAQFVTQFAPTQIRAGSSFWMQVTMKNVGTNTWTQGGGYSLMPASGYPAWGVNFVPLSGNESIVPGAQKGFTFACKAPTAPGTYTLRWQMHRSASFWTGFFGDQTVTRTITVVP